MATSTRSKTEVYMLGSVKEVLTGTKLPSVGDVLRFYLHQLKTSTTKHEAAVATLNEVKTFWDKARIPMRRIDNAVKQLEDLVKRWEGLKKNKARRTVTQVANEDALYDILNDVFDIAHQDALDMIKIPEDKAFLLAQREKGRRGLMAGVDISSVQKEKAQAEKAKNQLMWKEKQLADKTKLDRLVALESSTSSSESDDSSDSQFEEPIETSTPKTRKRGRKNILTSSVLSSLDRTKISDRRAVQVIAPIIHASGEKVAEYNVNRSSIQRQRKKHRISRAAELKAQFDPQKPLVLHWDGKMMEDLTGEQKIDRIAIIVSGCGIDQILRIPKLVSGTGQATADAVIDVVSDWGIKDRVKAISFDTTASNSGRKNGACTLIEMQLQRDVLYLACRHHIHEILLAEAFRITMGSSSGPEILLLKRFKEFWPNVNVADYKPGIEVPNIANQLQDVSIDVKNFVIEQLAMTHQRDDYRELLELTLMFLGEVPERGVSFRKPGAIHRARFMARLIYSLKIFMFRDTGFKLSKQEAKGLEDFCSFGVGFYVKAWFQCSLSTAAPANDLRLLKLLATANSPVVKVAMKKLCGHLWYLSEELVGLAFFDRNIDAVEKRAMVERLSCEGEEDPPKRISLDETIIPNKKLHDFVTQNTRKFFQILELPAAFLDMDPDTWLTNPYYLQAEEVVRELRVVNDTAERGVALMQEYNALMTKDEDQTQFALQVVQEHRKLYPDCKKSTVLLGLSSTSGGEN